MTTAHEDQTVKLLVDASHDFDDRGLHYHVSVSAGSHAREVLVDPAPAYPHDSALVERELQHLRRVAPLPFPLVVLLLGHEARSRSNGMYFDGYNYQGEQIEIAGVKRYPPEGGIVLGAKRIPIHPAVTRYVVAHEYGHGVMYHLARLRGIDDSKLMKAYAEECRQDTSASYGCGRWHANVGELFANDFRILVAEREVDYWPHPGFKRPDEILAVVGFWAKAMKEMSA